MAIFNEEYITNYFGDRFLQEENSIINIQNQNIKLYYKNIEIDNNVKNIIKKCWDLAKKDIKELLNKKTNNPKDYSTAIKLLSQINIVATKKDNQNRLAIEFWINDYLRDKTFLNNSSISIAYHYYNNTEKFLKSHANIYSNKT